MKQILIVIASLAIISCTHKSEKLPLTIDGKAVCIPLSYVINEGGSGFPSGDYDPAGGGLDYSILFSAQDVAKNIPKYRSRINVDGSQQFQVVYVMLDKENSANLTTQSNTLIPLKESPNLFRKSEIAINSPIFEKVHSSYYPWGSCSSLYANKENFDCSHQVPVKGIEMTYQIHSKNLPLYKDVDNFILKKLKTWQCRP